MFTGGYISLDATYLCFGVKRSVISVEPVLLKSLKLLRDTEALLTKKEIAAKIGEDETYVERALEKLLERGLLSKIGEYYVYQKTLVNEECSRKIFAVYRRVTKKAEGGWIIIGLLSTASQYKYLVRQDSLLGVLVAEGFDLKDTSSFLEEELKAGRISKLRIALISEKGGPLALPPAIPAHYISHLGMDSKEFEQLKKQYLETGFCVQEEDYLISDFPPEISEPARKYLETGGAHIKQKLTDEALEYWHRFGILRGFR